MVNPIERMQGPLFDLLAFLTGRGELITVILSFFSVAVIILLVFPIHECSHGVMAKWLGDDTAERQGRLSLNPFDHVDPMGAFAMCLCCIGWAKPVPVNIRNCKKVKARTALALTALAGPLSNIIMAYVFMIITKLLIYFVPMSQVLYYVVFAMDTVVIISIRLSIFNLIPVPPFDGSRFALAFLPPKTYFGIMRYEQQIMIGILVVLLLLSRLGFSPFSWIANNLTYLIANPVFKLMGAIL